MNQEVIEIILKSTNPDIDLLVFQIDDKEMSVNLNASDCQASLKLIFSELLNKLINVDIELKLIVDEGYNRQMYIEVCKEYIKDLNRELNECKMELRKLTRR